MVKKQIKDIIKTEISMHESNLSNYHAETIADAVYKQLTEYMSEDEMEKVVEIMRPEFIKIVDTLIPIVEEYEGKIDEVLDRNIGNIVTKL